MRTVECIVIGGSAGAIDALLAILAALDARVTCPIACVIHLPPDQPSLLPEILSRVCRRVVVEAEDKMPLAPGSIVIAPPNYHLLVERNRHLALSVDAPVHFSRPAIDPLFESASDAFGAGLVGVVLSGANQDGAAGLARIVAGGGVAVVQDPRSAAVEAMPAAAIRRLGTDAHVVPLDDLARFVERVAGVTTGDEEAFV